MFGGGNKIKLEKDLLEQLKPELEAIKPMSAVFDQHYVKKLEPTGNVKQGANKMELAEALMKDIPLGRLGSPDDIAEAVAYLASDAGAYVTGQTLHVNGGMVMP